jgi:hypothetical protein
MIFEAIAAIKIANEAIGAIKEFAGHVESVGAMGKDLTKLADSKAELEKAAKDGDMDAFWALEDIKNHEAEIKRQFIYAGRPGLWEDYCTFIKNRKMLREKQAKREAAEKARKKQLIKDILLGTAVTVGILGAVGIVVYAVYWMVSLKGK